MHNATISSARPSYLKIKQLVMISSFSISQLLSYRTFIRMSAFDYHRDPLFRDSRNYSLLSVTTYYFNSRGM